MAAKGKAKMTLAQAAAAAAARRAADAEEAAEIAAEMSSKLIDAPVAVVGAPGVVATLSKVPTEEKDAAAGPRLLGVYNLDTGVYSPALAACPANRVAASTQEASTQASQASKQECACVDLSPGVAGVVAMTAHEAPAQEISPAYVRKYVTYFEANGRLKNLSVGSLLNGIIVPLSQALEEANRALEMQGARIDELRQTVRATFLAARARKPSKKPSRWEYARARGVAIESDPSDEEGSMEGEGE